MKYIFKYEFKGNDMATVAVIDEVIDEIAIYQNKCYVSSCEAYWRIAEYKIVDMNPSVLDLHVHLEGEKSVTYEPNMKNAMESIEIFSRIMLTEYFKNNANAG